MQIPCTQDQEKEEVARMTVTALPVLHIAVLLDFAKKLRIMDQIQAMDVS